MSQNITDIIRNWVRFKKKLSSNIGPGILNNAVCTVEADNGEIGSGFLCSVTFLGRAIQLVITSHELLPTSCIEDVTETVFHFESFNLSLQSEFVSSCWTSRKRNATVIELSPQGEKHLKTLKATFLECGEDCMFDEKINIVGCNGLLNEPDSTIKSKRKDSFEYQLNSNKVQCGGPIMSSKNVVIGIQKKATKGELQKAKLLSKIILSFFEDRYRPIISDKNETDGRNWIYPKLLEICLEVLDDSSIRKSYQKLYRNISSRLMLERIPNDDDSSAINGIEHNSDSYPAGSGVKFGIRMRPDPGQFLMLDQLLDVDTISTTKFMKIYLYSLKITNRKQI